jgi:hypothetical protein
MSLLRKALPLAIGLIALGAAPASAGTVSNAQFGFCVDNCLNTTTTGKAGANVYYHFQWTVPSGFDGGDPPNGDNSQSFVIDGSGGKAPGTVFASGASNYQITYLTGGYSVHPFRSDAIQVTNGGERLVVTPYNGSLNVPPGATMGLDMYNSPKNGCTLGGGKFFSISTSLDSAANTNNFTLTAGDPSQVSPTGGNNQSATVGTAFAQPLQAKVTDSCGNNIQGTNVAFSGPGTGASGSFAAGTSTTDASGVATSQTLTANTVAGDWDATASVTGGSNPTATFDLTNDPGDVETAELGLDPSSISADGFATSTATLHLEDEFGNGVPGLDTGTVSFLSDGGHNFDSTNDAGDGDYQATLTSTNTPGNSLITGTYNGGVSPLPDTATLEQTADLIAPDATINIGPGKKSKDRTPTFYFSSDDENANFECKLDSEKYVECDSPFTTKKLGFGKHKLSVRARDSSDNVSDVDTLSFKIVK